MATVQTERAVRERLLTLWEEKPGLRSFLETVDHKRIGARYVVTAFAFFLVGGMEAEVIRTQLARPVSDVVGPETYNQLFSLHGTTMIFFFATPILSGFSNYFIPLMLGARDTAFPRLNAFSYWVFLLAGVFLYASVPFGQAPNAGWFEYPPLSSTFDPGLHTDFWALSLIFLSISTTAGAINLIVTILKLRAPGMTLARMPLFAWAVLATSFMMVFALPPLTLGNILLELDRRMGMRFYDPAAGGGPILFQHLFWLFGHPDVYIIFLPAVGIVSTVIPIFSRHTIVGYHWMALATVATAILGFGVWVHHMFATGLPTLSLTYFSAASMIITIPSAVQIFGWLATMIRGRPVTLTPFLFAAGFIVVFVVGGVTGVMFASVPFDQQITDSYFIVAHFHYVLFGGAVFPIFAGLHLWLPKMSGRMYVERWGRITFWLIFIGFNLTFFPMHMLGLLGMPRRVATYPGDIGWNGYNLASTLGAYILGLGVLVFMANALWSFRRGRPSGPDPWGGDSLEWATTSPPAPYNFASIPVVTGRSPLWGQSSLGSAIDLAEDRYTLGTTLHDAVPDEALEMPSETPLPLLLASALALTFTGLLVGSPWFAAAAGIASLAFLGRWASHNGGRPGL